MTEPTSADLAAFGASEAACYLYPNEDQQPLRAAYCAGAASMAIPSSADVIEGMREALLLPGLEHAIWLLACDGQLPNSTIEAILSAEIRRIEAALALPDSKPDKGGA